MSGESVVRTCANCCGYTGGECLNLGGPVDAGGRCELHETEAEFQSDVAAIKKFRERLGLPTNRPAPEED